MRRRGFWKGFWSDDPPMPGIRVIVWLMILFGAPAIYTYFYPIPGFLVAQTRSKLSATAAELGEGVLEVTRSKNLDERVDLDKLAGDLAALSLKDWFYGASGTPTLRTKGSTVEAVYRPEELPIFYDATNGVASTGAIVFIVPVPPGATWRDLVRKQHKVRAGFTPP